MKRCLFFCNLTALIIISAAFIGRMYRASMEPQTFAYNVLCFVFVIASSMAAGLAIGAAIKRRDITGEKERDSSVTRG